MGHVEDYWRSEAYRTSRQERAKVIYALLHDILPHGGVWVDIGAGPGILKEELHRQFGVPIWGVERDPTLPVVRERMITGDALSLPFRSASVDVVFFNHVLEHIPEGEKALQEISRILKPGGKLYVATPNLLWFFEVHYRLPLIHWFPGPARNAGVRLLGKGQKFEVFLWRYRHLVRVLEGLRFRVINLVPRLFYERPYALRKAHWRLFARLVQPIPWISQWVTGPFSPQHMILAVKRPMETIS